MSYPISYADLADSWPENPLFGATCAEAAKHEERERIETAFYDDVQAIISEVPNTRAKVHDEDCWKLHASCLAKRIGEL